MPKKSRASLDLTPKECALLTSNAQLNDEEIREWHAAFLREYPTGQLDRETFVNFYRRLRPDDAADFENLFDMIDVNEDGTIDFNELLVLIAIRTGNNNLEQRLEFMFDLWDDSEDGKIDVKELTNLISAMYLRAGKFDEKSESDPKKRAKQIIAKFDLSGDKKLSKEEFVTGCVNDPNICELLLSGKEKRN